MKIAVVGSGVVGLTTALELQSEYRNAQIFIIADKFYKETTSYVAGKFYLISFEFIFNHLNILQLAFFDQASEKKISQSI
jgi:glycine/D-amino acid oxidase-like deaminating enzyme